MVSQQGITLANKYNYGPLQSIVGYICTCLFPIVFAELNKRMHVAYSPKYSNIFQLELAANKIQKQLLE